MHISFSSKLLLSLRDAQLDHIEENSLDHRRKLIFNVKYYKDYGVALLWRVRTNMLKIGVPSLVLQANKIKYHIEYQFTDIH